MATVKGKFTISRLGELNQLEGQIDKLERRARIVGDAASPQHLEQMANLVALRDQIRRKLKEVETAPPSDWQEAARELDDAINDLEAATRAVVAGLRR